MVAGLVYAAARLRGMNPMLVGKALKRAGLGGLLCAMGLCAAARAGQAEGAKPVVVQPGAPGQPTRRLPDSTRAKLPPRSDADVKFMQGMIMHHAQAVEMTALIASHTDNTEVRALGARISRSQSDEIKFMRRWLAARGERSMEGMSSASRTAAASATNSAKAS